MSEDEEEYIVESIIAARVKRRGRGKAWEYRVRWKGYSEKDDTWEPIESFAGAEHFVESFWMRASKLLNGRDIQDFNAFKIGEQFFPVGPPLRKLKSLPALKATSPVASSSKPSQTTPNNNKRPRTLTPTIPEEPSPKRARQLVNTGTESPSARRINRTATSVSPRRSARKPQKEPSVVPASEDEEDSEAKIVTSETPPRSRRHSTDDNIGQNSLDDNETQRKADLPIPAHSARAANPLVHMADDLGGMDGAISVKTRISSKDNAKATSKPSTPASANRRKPGPGRSSEGLRKSKTTSSLLTFDKGESKTVKGKFVATEYTARHEEINEIDEGPPASNDPSSRPVVLSTGAELLQLAARAVNMEDFDEIIDTPLSGPSDEPNSKLQRSLSLAKESLFPSRSAIPFASAAFNKRPTIFGPLGSGSDVRPNNTDDTTNITQVVQTQPFSVTLDVSRKLPVILTELSPGNAPILDKIVRNASRGPPGKFYSDKAALAIIDTFRTGGASAKVIPSPNATEFETQEFEKFSERLSRNELFVLMIDFDLLVFCSSSSTLITERLNIPLSLLSEPGKLLAERVSISNHSAYANAVLQANE
ncbi:hypothetical protein F5050DRAFT_1862811 [Lentinula boryana]|uniref:Chromo domain-containing protein n=1 Tax=Lentinula boryana TaxID=40481 RepID=A0ABQ8QLB1_9AGAR|nr:hypothetical protein F5050DRAFT_1862811 [Lentinula boryana]